MIPSPFKPGDVLTFWPSVHPEHAIRVTVIRAGRNGQSYVEHYHHTGERIRSVVANKDLRP
jgi:hypothetical protein